VRIRYCFDCVNEGGVKVKHCPCLLSNFNIGSQLLA